MNTALNLLEKLSAKTGELAVYKEKGVLSVVKVENIKIEPDLLSFTLKPKHGRNFGLGNLKAFTICSSFEYLNYENGRYYSSSIIGWELETEPAKVNYLKNIINEGSEIDEILSAFRSRGEFYDRETLLVINKLMKLKNNIKYRKIVLARDLEFKGQAWGGAGVMVISNDEETKKRYSHFEGYMVISNYAPQIGDLFRRVGHIAASSPNYDHLSKQMFWNNLTLAVKSAKQDNIGENLEQICDKVILMAIEFVSKKRSGSSKKS